MREGLQHEIVFTADDLGWDEPANLTMERAHREGVLSAASLMLGQPGTLHALEIARRNPGLQIGCHFHLCDSQPLTCAKWPWGRSPARAGLALAVWPPARALVRRELAAQWEGFTATGLACRFLNGHHHLHIHPFVARAVHELVGPSFTGWVRGFDVRFFGKEPGVPYRRLRRASARWLRPWPPDRRTSSLWGLDRLFRMDAGEIARVLPTLPAGRHEFLFHPRHLDDPDATALVELRKLCATPQPR